MKILLIALLASTICLPAYSVTIEERCQDITITSFLSNSSFLSYCSVGEYKQDEFDKCRMHALKDRYLNCLIFLKGLDEVIKKEGK